jgi:Fe2+ or Zn2+ uptake regulation protein
MNKVEIKGIIRKTKQREAILKVLKATDTHPTAQWIHEQVRRELPHISLGTVYRDLKMLKQRGDIAELDFGGSQSRFDGNTGKHSHFCCLECQNIFDIAEPVANNLDAKVAEKSGFDVHYHRLEFFGLCHHCRQAKQFDSIVAGEENGGRA